jgi:hypothetical protein
LEDTISYAYTITDDCIPGGFNPVENSIVNPPHPFDGADPITWTARTPSPVVGRYWCPGSGVVRDTIWFCGGRTSAAASIADIVAYVPASDAWVTTGLPVLLTARRAGGGGRIGNKIYVACGRNASSVTINTCEEFDVDTKVVTTKASAPAAVWACCGAVAAGKLYIVGSELGGTNCYEYDPTTNTWATKTPCPSGMGWSTAAGTSTKLYVFGGASGGTGCYEFNPATNTWATKASMPGMREYAMAVAVNDEDIYVVGGAGSSGTADNIVYKYNIASNSWTTDTPLLVAKGWEMCNQVGNAIYASYGSNCITPTYLTDNEAGSVTPPPANDVGMLAIRAPGAAHSVNTPMTPIGVVKNFGTAAQGGFQVVCSIVGATVYTNTQTVTGPLAANDTARVTFAPYTPTTSENVTVIMRTLLAGDQNSDNNRLTRTTIIGQIYLNDFEANNGNFTPDPAASAWEWGVPTSGPMAAYSGTKLWATVLAGNYASSANWKLTSASFTALSNNPLFQFMHWYAMEATYDGGNVKYSTDGTNWILLTPTVDPYNGTGYTGTGIAGEACWSGTTAGNNWHPAAFVVPVNSGQQFMMRFHFGSDPSVVYAGWYVDDVMLVGAAPAGIMEQEPNKVLITTLSTVKPNPVTNGLAHISFSIAEPTKASLNIYDASGRLVRTLLNSKLNAGNYNLSWNGTDDHNNNVAEGIYFYTLTTDNNNFTKKLVFTR